ncbi:cytoplasmic protein [Salmonella enterica subsp. enterica serovar Newport str. 36803]|nr:cytoplasmic protein [Salmonella enterica subsp. enterica serovar Newport str. 36803]
MPTYKQVVNHVKKHVLWKDEYFERYYRLNPELVQKRLDKIYQAEDDLMVLISTQPGLYRVPDLSVKLATDGYQRGHDYGCSCQVVRVGDNVSAAGCNGVA